MYLYWSGDGPCTCLGGGRGDRPCTCIGVGIDGVLHTLSQTIVLGVVVRGWICVGGGCPIEGCVVLRYMIYCSVMRSSDLICHSVVMSK